MWCHEHSWLSLQFLHGCWKPLSVSGAGQLRGQDAAGGVRVVRDHPRRAAVAGSSLLPTAEGEGVGVHVSVSEEVWS